MNLKSPIGRFRLIAILEGISYLSFAITVPLKYAYAITGPNYFVGMIHGWLFMIYILLGFLCRSKYHWKLGKFFLILLASLVPFGTFIVDAKILRVEEK